MSGFVEPLDLTGAVEAAVEVFVFPVVEAEDGVDILRVEILVLIVPFACLVLLERGAHNLLLNLLAQQI